MRRVPREEHPARAETVGEGGARPEVGGPQHLGDVLGGEVRAGGHDLPYGLGGEVHPGALGEPGDQLEVVRAA